MDWVALTSGTLLLGTVVVYAVFREGVSPLVQTMSATLASVEPNIDVGDAPFSVDESSADESSGSAGTPDSPPSDWNHLREKEYDRLQ